MERHALAVTVVVLVIGLVLIAWWARKGSDTSAGKGEPALVATSDDGSVAAASPQAVSDPPCPVGAKEFLESLGADLSRAEFGTYLDEVSIGPEERGAAERLASCVGHGPAAAAIETVRLGRYHRGSYVDGELEVGPPTKGEGSPEAGSPRFADVQWLAEAPMPAVELLFAVGDGAAPVVVDAWDLLSSQPEAARAGLSVAAATTAGDAEANLAALLELADQDREVLLELPVLAPMVLAAPPVARSACVQLVAEHGERGLAVLSALYRGDLLDQCVAAAQGGVVDWLLDSPSEAVLAARLPVISDVQAAAFRIQGLSGWGNADVLDAVTNVVSTRDRAASLEDRWKRTADWLGSSSEDDVLLALVAPNLASAAAPGEAAQAARELGARLGAPDAGPFEYPLLRRMVAQARMLGPLSDEALGFEASPERAVLVRLLALEQVIVSLGAADGPTDGLARAFGLWPEATTRAAGRLLDWEDAGHDLIDASGRVFGRRGHPETWVVASAVTSPEHAGKMLEKLDSRALVPRKHFEVALEGPHRGKWRFSGAEALRRTLVDLAGIGLLKDILKIIRIYARGEEPSSELLTGAAVEAVTMVLVSLIAMATLGGGTVAAPAARQFAKKLFGKLLRSAEELLTKEAAGPLARALQRLLRGALVELPGAGGTLLKQAGRRWHAASGVVRRMQQRHVGRFLLRHNRVVVDGALTPIRGATGGPSWSAGKLLVSVQRGGSMIPGLIQRPLEASARSRGVSFVTGLALRGSGTGLKGAGEVLKRLPEPVQRRVCSWMLKGAGRRGERAVGDAAYYSALTLERSALVGGVLHTTKVSPG